MVAVNVPEVKEKPKRKKATATKKKDQSGFSSDMVADLITGLSGVVATRPNMAHWMIDKEEAKQISDPLCKVIEKNEQLKKVAEHSDSIALAVACLTVFAPRMYITATMVKEEKKKKKQIPVSDPEKVEVKRNDSETRKTEKNSGKHHKSDATANTNVDPSLSDLLSFPVG